MKSVHVILLFVMIVTFALCMGCNGQKEDGTVSTPPQTLHVEDQPPTVIGMELTKDERSNIVNETIPVANSIVGPDSPIVLKGKVILFRWVPGTYSAHDYNFWVPDDLIARNDDEEITVLLMAEEKNEEVGTWVNEAGEEFPGFRRTTEIIGIYWPEIEPAGKAHVVGSEPKEKEYIYTESAPYWVMVEKNKLVRGIVGDVGITEWISQLPTKS